MFKLHIGNKEVAFKERLTISEWQEILRFSPEIEENWPRLVSKALNITVSEANEIPQETMTVVMGILISKMNPTSGGVNPMVRGAQLLDFDKMTFGDFVDLEVLIGRDPQQNMSRIASVLYSRANTDEWYLEDVWPAFQYYLTWRQELYRRYKALFEIDDVQEGTVDKENKQDPIHNWYDLIMVLADEKFLNIELVVERPLIEAFNFLAWKKEQAIKQQIELAKRKKNKII